MKFVRFVDAMHEAGVYGLVEPDGRIEILAGGLLDPVKRTGETVREANIIRYLPPVDPPNIRSSTLWIMCSATRAPMTF